MSSGKGIGRLKSYDLLVHCNTRGRAGQSVPAIDRRSLGTYVVEQAEVGPPEVSDELACFFVLESFAGLYLEKDPLLEFVDGAESLARFVLDEHPARALLCESLSASGSFLL